jgi:hypothetical protein
MTIRQQVPNNKGCNKINLSSETASITQIPVNCRVLRALYGKNFRLLAAARFVCESSYLNCFGIIINIQIFPIFQKTLKAQKRIAWNW